MEARPDLRGGPFGPIGMRETGCAMRISGRAAFTLVEMLIVVVILAIMAGIALPYFSDTSFEARVVTAQNVLRTMATALDVYRVRYSRPNYPPTVMGSWFSGGVVPLNAFAADGSTAGSVEVVNIAGATNPSGKTLGTGVAHYWYNRSNGVLRARVPSMGTTGATNSLYDRVNSVSQTFVNVLDGGAQIDDIRLSGGAMVAE